MNKDEPTSYDQCLRDYLDKYGPEKLAVYSGFTEDKIRGFLTKRPCGQEFIRLAMFLDNEGYSVYEIERLPGELYDLAKVILAGYIDYRGLQLKYPQVFTYGRDSVSELFRRPHRFGQRMYEKAKGIFDEWKALHPELGNYPIAARPLTVTPAAPRRYGSKAKTLQVKSTTKNEVTQSNGIPETVNVKNSVLVSFALLIETAMPLAQAIQSDQFTPEDRYALRVKLLPEGRLTKFVELMSSLLSEHAREKNR